MKPHTSLLLVAVALGACLGAKQSAALQVPRLLQAEFAGQKIGSRTYSAEGFLTLHEPNAKTFKAVIALPVNSTTPEVLAEHTQQRSGLSGVLLLLPPHYGSKPPSADDAKQLLLLEHQLLQKSTAVPVFFAKETPELTAAVADARDAFARGNPPSQHADRTQIRIQGTLPTKVPAKQAVNYVASLRATDDQFKPGVPVAPTLLITAHYDCFSPAPAAPACADSAGSGAAAALLLLRMLNRMFASVESRPARNILVLLTAGGPYGQEGLRQWLADADPQQVEAIEAAIVFDSIGGSTVLRQQAAAALGDAADSSVRQQQQLHVHTTSSGASEQWLKALQGAAERAGVGITPVTKDLPADAAAAASGGKAADGSSAAEASAAGAAGFGHEHLVRRGLPAVTLSSMAAAPAPVLSGRVRASSVGDVVAGVSLDGVLSAAQVAADAVSRWLYPEVDAELRLLDLSADVAAHKDFLRGWVGLLAEVHPMMPFTQADGVGALLHDSLRAFLKANSHSLKRHVWSTAGSPAALEAWTGTSANLQVVKVAGFLQDMVLTVSVVSYLLALFGGLVVGTRGWKELTALLKPKQTSKQQRRSGSIKRS